MSDIMEYENNGALDDLHDYQRLVFASISFGMVLIVVSHVYKFKYRRHGSFHDRRKFCDASCGLTGIEETAFFLFKLNWANNDNLPVLWSSFRHFSCLVFDPSPY